VCWQLPQLEGHASGLALRGVCDGLVRAGHELELWSWGDEQPREELPPWARWEPLPPEPALRTRLRALVRPRSDIVRAGWRPAPDSIAVAEDPLSFAAVEGAPRSVVVVHFLTRLDARAVGRMTPRDVQSRRNERHVMRAADLCLTLSERVKGDSTATVVPVACPMPAEPVPFVEAPVAALMSDWRWPPNRAALDTLVGEWHRVRARVPAARLVVAGRHIPSDAIGAVEGVDVIGEVGHASELYAQAAVIAFPCPPSSGPKMKTLQAIAHGVPVVTTPAGAEGLVLGPGDGVVVTGSNAFVDTLAATLTDPETRADLARRGRAAALAHHSPEAAAAARIAAYRARFGEVS